jgi:hypothetical protein
MNLATLGTVAKQVLGTVAPTLLTALGGPFGALAGAALHLAMGTGGDEKAVDTQLAGATQDTLLKVKQAEIDFKAKIAELGIQEEQLAYADLADARQMQMTTRDPTVARLAWLVIGGFLLISLAELVAMVLWPERVKLLPEAAWLLIGSVLGYLANESKQAGAFYFGSSAGSQAKDATISDMAKKP